MPAAFAPIGTSWPSAMICEFLSNVGIDTILVEASLLLQFKETLQKYDGNSSENHPKPFRIINDQALSSIGFTLVKLQDIKQELPKLSLAFVIQTSGTTGKPTTVMVPHQCIVPNIISLSQIFAVTPEDSVIVVSPYTFDPFVVQVFLALEAGARAVLLHETDRILPSRLCSVIKSQNITILQPTPSLMNYIGLDLIRTSLLAHDSPLRVLALGGEPFPSTSVLFQWKHPDCTTKIFNLYGITEVSSWATCQKIVICSKGAQQVSKDGVHLSVDERIPIGEPLQDTLVDIRDEEGKKISHGIGQMYIGGHNRICFLNNEMDVSPGTMRASGDWALINNDQIWFLGRKDRQIKRLGQRTNLLWIEQALARVLPRHTFVAVVVKSKVSSEQQMFQLPKMDRLHLFVTSSDDSSSWDLSFRVRSIIKDVLPVHAHPDHIHIVSDLPLTSHGKVDMETLLEGIRSYQHVETSSRGHINKMWLEATGFGNNTGKYAPSSEKDRKDDLKKSRRERITEGDEDYDLDTSSSSRLTLVEAGSMFLASGGNSLQAVKLAESITWWLQKNKSGKCLELDDLLDVILNKPFGELCRYVEQKCSVLHTDDERLDKGAHVISEWNGNSGVSTIKVGKLSSGEDCHRLPGSGAQFSVGESITDPSGKRSCLRKQGFNVKRIKHGATSSVTDVFEPKGVCCCSVRRGVQITICKLCAGSSSSQPISHSDCVSYSGRRLGNRTVQLSKKWRANLYKCTDASPLVVGCRVADLDSTEKGSGEAALFHVESGLVYVGSHAHVFKAMRLSDGEVMWETEVGDRIESSAVLSRCGTCIIFGCYDGKIYIINRFSGVIGWTYQTHAPVKSSPCVDPTTGLVWVGSHDHHLYALDITNRVSACAIDCGGSCFSSPRLNPTWERLFAATLSGVLLCINTSDMMIDWSTKCPKPVFASPLVTDVGVVCGCVDGYLYAFDLSGAPLWSLATSGPIFSSPVLARRRSLCQEAIVFGCHDSHVYCVSTRGELEWSFKADSPIYSTPFIVPFNNIVQLREQSFTPNDISKVVGVKVRQAEHSFSPNDISDVDGNVECPAFVHLNSTCNESVSENFISTKRDTLEDELVLVASTRGTVYMLTLDTGCLLGSMALPGEVFSSPVIGRGAILIGCRDNYLYSLKVESI
ncbi:beta-alanine-activating enzyme isoform X2 [Nematostella vectensis]|nr:beta-alanine-activating enzyme isoform X2 [Nematostella vectensis]